jgi:type IV pilus assembly protein PilM
MGTFFGLDIGSSEIKALEVQKVDQGFKLKHFAAMPIQGKDSVEVIKAVIKEAGIKSTAEVNVALPESEVYTRIVSTPKLSETELASSIQYEAEQYVPVPLAEVELFHQVLDASEIAQDEKKMKVLLIAVTKERLKRLTSILDNAQLIPKSLETELFSLQRVFTDVNKTQLLLSINYKTTDMMIMTKGLPLFLHSMASGSMAMTRTLMNELSLSEEQAEQYKRTYGIRGDLLEGKVAGLLAPLVNEVVSQIKKAMVYLNQQGFSKQPEQLVLTGGGALLPGLSAYLVKATNMEVVVGNPFRQFVETEELTKLITAKNNPQLAAVTGLAIKGLV